MLVYAPIIYAPCQSSIMQLGQKTLVTCFMILPIVSYVQKSAFVSRKYLESIGGWAGDNFSWGPVCLDEVMGHHAQCFCYILYITHKNVCSKCLGYVLNYGWQQLVTSIAYSICIYIFIYILSPICYRIGLL